jgi:hypothetical protein
MEIMILADIVRTEVCSLPLATRYHAKLISRPMMALADAAIAAECDEPNFCDAGTDCTDCGSCPLVWANGAWHGHRRLDDSGNKAEAASAATNAGLLDTFERQQISSDLHQHERSILSAMTSVYIF